MDQTLLKGPLDKTEESSENEVYWKRKTEQDFGDLFTVYHLFDSTSVDVAPDLKEKYMDPPPSWQQYYHLKRQRLDQTNPLTLKQQVQQEIDDATLALEKSIKEDNSISFNHLVSKMLWILDLIPGQGGCYYVLASILYYLHHDQVRFVLNEGRRLDPTFKPLMELEDEINNDGLLPTAATNANDQPSSSLSPFLPLKGKEIDNDTPYRHNGEFQQHQRRRSSLKLPVLDPDGTALSPPLLQVLHTLFSEFDKDQDDALRHEELDHYVFSTNGQHPSDEFLEAMGQRFGANDKGWLTKEGFLAFYLEQTLGDQDETRKDMAAHGYDRWTLRKL